MAISYKPCSQCKKPMDLRVLPTLTGDEGDYRILLESMPTMICAENHKRLIYPEFAMRVLDAIADPAYSGIYAASRRGFLRKRTQCAKCEAVLVEHQRNSRTFRVTFLVESIPPLEIVLTAPCLKCPKCGTDQLPRNQDFNDFIFKAMAHAFSREEIRAQ